MVILRVCIQAEATLCKLGDLLIDLGGRGAEVRWSLWISWLKFLMKTICPWRYNFGDVFMGHPTCKCWPWHASVFTGDWWRSTKRKTKVWTVRLVPSRSDSWALPPAPKLKSRTRRRSGCPRPAPCSLRAERQRCALRRPRLRPRRALRCRGSPRLLVGPGALKTEPRTHLPPRSCSPTRRPPRPES